MKGILYSFLYIFCAYIAKCQQQIYFDYAAEVVSCSNIT